MSVSKKARALAARTSDAYSHDRYGSWAAVAQALLSRGLDENQAEYVMRSKITRWAADSSDAPYGKVPASAVTDYADRWPEDFATSVAAAGAAVSRSALSPYRFSRIDRARRLLDSLSEKEREVLLRSMRPKGTSRS